MMGPQRKNKIRQFLISQIVFVTILLCVEESDSVVEGGNDDKQFITLSCLRFPNPSIKCRAVNVSSGNCPADNTMSIPSNPENDEKGEIVCNATSPIDLSFAGYRLDDYVTTKLIRENESYSISFPLSGVRATREVIISIVKRPSENLTFVLFRPGRRLFSTNFDAGLTPDTGIPIPHTEKYNIRLPCIPNDPNAKLRLVSAPKKSMVNTTGSPTKGIIIELADDEDPSGNYTCEAKLHSQTNQSELIHFEVQPSPNNTCEPSTGEVKLFHKLGGKTRISCKSKESTILDAIVDNKRENPIQVNHSKATLPFEKYVDVYWRNSAKITCSSETNKLCSWDVESLEIALINLDIDTSQRLKLSYKRSENKILCETRVFDGGKSEIGLQLVFCQGETECRLNQFCFDEREVSRQALNQSNCKSTVQGTWTNGLREAQYVILPQDWLSNKWASQGMLRCSWGRHVYQTNYFVGFNDVLYLNSGFGDYRIDIIVVNKTMERGKSYPFVCKASKFISNGVLQWAVYSKSEGTVYLQNDGVEDFKGVYASEFDHQLYTVRESVIKLDYPDEFDLICRVPMWDTERWYTHRKTIVYREGFYLYKNLRTTPEAPETTEFFSTTEPPDVMESTNGPEKNSKASLIVAISVGYCLAVIFLLGLIIFIFWRIKKHKEKRFQTSLATPKEYYNLELLEEKPENLNIAMEVMNNVSKYVDRELVDAYEIVDTLPYNREFEIPREKLFIDSDKVLGKGQFGTVFRGSVEGISGAVAVKTVNTDSELCRKGFLRELKVMIYIGEHPNIIKLLGASTDRDIDDTLYVVVELCEKGSLEGYLRANKLSFVNQIIDDEIQTGSSSRMEALFSSYATPASLKPTITTVTTTELIKWSQQIAIGMEFLAMKRVVHADLATRNILIDGKDDAKITDFGLSRRLYDLTEYVKKQQEPLPWRWMAVESLQQLKFTSQSDVWSFGILLWEIFSLGDVPYPGLVWRLDFVQQLKDGLRMSQPSYCNTEIYNLMLDCWEEAPEQRPSFGELSQYFKSIQDNMDSEQEEEVEEPLDDYTHIPTLAYSSLNDDEYELNGNDI